VVRAKSSVAVTATTGIAAVTVIVATVTARVASVRTVAIAVVPSVRLRPLTAASSRAATNEVSVTVTSSPVARTVMTGSAVTATTVALAAIVVSVRNAVRSSRPSRPVMRLRP
jgi:hypothetical protein